MSGEQDQVVGKAKEVQGKVTGDERARVRGQDAAGVPAKSSMPSAMLPTR